MNLIQLLKRFAGLDIDLLHNSLMYTRIRLTLWYTLIASAVVFFFSYGLYKSLMFEIILSMRDTYFDIPTQQTLIHEAARVLQNRIIFTDIISIFFIAFVSFILTHYALRPLMNSISQQKRFIANASHELKTPLTVIKAKIDISLDRLRDSIDSREYKTLTDISNEIDIMIELSRYLLDITRFDMYEIPNKQKINALSVLKTSMDSLTVLAQQKPVTLMYHSGAEIAVIDGNPESLQRAFVNVIENAIKYTPAGNTVIVSTALYDNNVVISIVDSGIGIEQRHLKRIFEPFYRVDESHTETGFGIGLALTHTIISSHNGTIVVDSIIKQGTTVTITLPLLG